MKQQCYIHVCLLAFVLGCFGTAIATEKPNVVYILADDLGYGDIGCFGQEKFATPNIDRMAREGMRFTQHYSGSTVCAPSRCALMTGLHTGHCFVRGNKEHKPVGQEPMPQATVTIAKLLKKAGYATGGFGKWGLGYPGSTSDPIKMGFDEFFGYNCQRNAHTYYPTWLYDNEQQISLDGKTYAHDLIMDRALAFIRKNAGRPFFCFMPITIPHAAMHAPESYVAPFRKQFAEFEGVIGKYAGPQVKNPVAAFAGMMTKFDEDVGRILGLLKELGIADRTLVMFTSDNGPHMEGGHKPLFFNSNGPLSGHKRDLTEGGIRVPTIAWWPGKVKAGSETDHISAFWDVMPTLCEMAGVDAPKDIDGISFLPTLLGHPEAQTPHDYLYWEFFERGGKRAVRMGNWKAIQRHLHKNPSPIVLYNLADDLGETNDVAGEHPQIVERAKAIFKIAHTPSRIWAYQGE